jgi:hypothetical protein
MEPAAAGTQVAASTAAGAAVRSSWPSRWWLPDQEDFQTAADNLRALLEDRAL